ncbi:MAG TPA: hypothetical protein EYN69_05635 [Flavobacteriales bacterium]|nr:hypothetical protein [Flavobacteriales bacterium]
MLRNRLYLLVGATLVVGLLLKFMHWPGAGTMLITSLGGIAIALLEYAIRNRKSKLLTRNIIYPLLGVVYVLGILFKVMHLPGAGIMLVVSMIGLSFALAEFAFSIRKSVHAILPLLFSITVFFALFRILHWPEPPYVLYGSYFVFAILVPVLLFLRGYKLKNTEPNLSSHFMVLTALSFILCLVEFKLKLYPEGLGMEKYMHPILDVLLLSGLLLYIRKTLQIEQLKIKFQNDHKLLQCLGGIYLIQLVILVLASK